MATKSRDIIKTALLYIGAIAASENPSADMSSDALKSLNRMLDSWSTQNLLIYQASRDVLPIVTPGQEAYTIGAVGADLTTQRPQSNIQSPIPFLQ